MQIKSDYFSDVTMLFSTKSTQVPQIVIDGEFVGDYIDLSKCILNKGD